MKSAWDHGWIVRHDLVPNGMNAFRPCGTSGLSVTDVAFSAMLYALSVQRVCVEIWPP